MVQSLIQAQFVAYTHWTMTLNTDLPRTRMRISVSGSPARTRVEPDLCLTNGVFWMNSMKSSTVLSCHRQNNDTCWVEYFGIEMCRLFCEDDAHRPKLLSQIIFSFYLPHEMFTHLAVDYVSFERRQIGRIATPGVPLNNVRKTHSGRRTKFMNTSLGNLTHEAPKTTALHHNLSFQHHLSCEEHVTASQWRYLRVTASQWRYLRVACHDLVLTLHVIQDFHIHIEIFLKNAQYFFIGVLVYDA